MSSVKYRPRQPLSTGGHVAVSSAMEVWPPSATLDDVSRFWAAGPPRFKADLDAKLAKPLLAPGERIERLIDLASYHLHQSQADRAYAVLEEAQTIANTSRRPRRTGSTPSSTTRA